MRNIWSANFPGAETRDCREVWSYSHLNARISDIACPFWGQFAPSGRPGLTPPRPPLRQYPRPASDRCPPTVATISYTADSSSRLSPPRSPAGSAPPSSRSSFGPPCPAPGWPDCLRSNAPDLFPALGIGQRSHVRQYVPGFGINPPQFARIMVGIRRLYDRSFETSSRNQFRDILRVVQYPNPRFLQLSVLFGKTFVANGASCYQRRNMMFTK